MAEKTLILKRSGLVLTEEGHKSKAIAMMGTLRIDGTGLEYVSMERGGNYVRLPEGKKLALYMHRTSRHGETLYVMQKGDNGHNILVGKDQYAEILIHAASLPHHLTGCIAPGRANPGSGSFPLVDSRKCLNEIIAQLGGFHINWMKPCGYLVVEKAGAE